MGNFAAMSLRELIRRLEAAVHDGPAPPVTVLDMLKPPEPV
jgi:hypothetical protein